jgi:diaminopimelate epimerase
MTEQETIIDFVKMTGAGNDFILVDNRTEKYTLPWSLIASRMCDRRFGIGADGLLIIEPSREASFRMAYFNADGSYGGMCGNGGRCAASFIMQDLNLDTVQFEALDYMYQARQDLHGIRLKMKPPTDFTDYPDFEAFGRKIPCYSIDTGAPHVVVFVEDLDDVTKSMLNGDDFCKLGLAIRSHARFEPNGTNVDFVEKLGTNLISMRTYERGIEAETLACGTGAVACALVSSIVRGLVSPVEILTRSNEILTVNFQLQHECLDNVELSGSARMVFTGMYKLVSMPEVKGSS